MPDQQEFFSVSQAVSFAKNTLKQLPALMVVGEVSGFKRVRSSGHCYFDLKDDQASMRCIIWSYAYDRMDIDLKDGTEVILTGSFDVYTNNGSMSFIATSARISGEGELRVQVERLKKKLMAEGLCDASRKRPIPELCERIAVVTSPTGAVIDDVKRTLKRRCPLVHIQLCPAQVQGEGSAQSCIRALKCAEAQKPDAILLVRGGGSYEDLMTFNDEALARAVAACSIPVVTGIGHEPDESICDFVADRRTSTPTAAAESVAPTQAELYERLVQHAKSMTEKLQNKLKASQDKMDANLHRLVHMQKQTLTHFDVQLTALADRPCLRDPHAFFNLRLSNLEQSGMRLDDAYTRFVNAQKQKLAQQCVSYTKVKNTLLDRYDSHLQYMASTLDALSPLKVLSRGYSFVEDADAHVIKSAEQLKAGQEITVRFSRDKLHAKVTDIQTDI